jgi:hypothetical protein
LSLLDKNLFNSGGRWIRTPGPGSKGRRFRRTTEGAGAFERTVCGWDREFESPLLQRRVRCKLALIVHGDGAVQGAAICGKRATRAASSSVHQKTSEETGTRSSYSTSIARVGGNCHPRSWFLSRCSEHTVMPGRSLGRTILPVSPPPGRPLTKPRFPPPGFLRSWT